MSALPPTPGALSGGDTPGSTPLTLGGVQFNSIECPAELPIGSTEQKLAVIEMIGGGRVVQPLGIQPKTVEWKGTLWGGDIASRVQDLRSYVVTAQPQTITYLQENWQCVVKEFTTTWKQPWVCDYSITIEIVTGGALTDTSFPTEQAQTDGNNDAIQSLLNQLAAQAAATDFLPINVAWQLYLTYLGILYASEQTYQ